MTDRQGSRWDVEDAVERRMFLEALTAASLGVLAESTFEGWPLLPEREP